MNLFKKAKNAVLVLRVDADAVVLDPYSNMAVKQFGRHCNNRGAAGRHKFNGITQKIG